jgi:hypothetical protein
MALSGTTLTVTTLTTAGLLTNNTSGQISSVTGSSLASLLGGSPTFTGLNLSGLSTGLLKNTSGVGVSIALSSDYQLPMSSGTNINISSDVISTVASPSFTGVTLSASPLANCMLKTVSGVISAAVAYSDYTPALTANGNVTITLGVIDTLPSPAFTRVNCSTLGINNTLSGTLAGGALLNSGLGSNSLYGYSAGSGITSGTYNTCIGYNTGTALTTGSNCLYIGNGANASVATISNEGVVNVSGLAITGRGANTLLLNASAGVYGYIPYSVNLYNNGVATSSQVEQLVLNAAATNIGSTPTITSGVITGLALGVYNITLTGAVNGSSQTIYPTLQYRANGGSFVTIIQTAVAFSGAWMCDVSFSVDVRISNVADAIRIFYPTTAIYGNTGTVPALYNQGGYNGYLNRYLRITFISL